MTRWASVKKPWRSIKIKDKWGFDEVAKQGVKNPWTAQDGTGVGPLPPL